MTKTELRNLLVMTLSRTAGGSPRRWRIAVGEITLYPIATHAHCNWAIDPKGTIGENAAIEDALDRVRLDHPYVVCG